MDSKEQAEAFYATIYAHDMFVAHVAGRLPAKGPKVRGALSQGIGHSFGKADRRELSSPGGDERKDAEHD